MIKPATTRIVLELDVGSMPMAGRLHDAGNRVRDFAGWVEFTQAMDQALAGSAPRPIPHPSEATMPATGTDAMPGYLLDAAWSAERDRLTSLTQLFDPTTLQLSTGLGLAAGWRCLEVGAGTGTVAELFATEVGVDGSVLAIDLDTRFLEPLATDNLQVQQLNVVTDPLPPARFDLVHARLLLEHLPARDQVLASMVEAVAPGGWLLVEDFDWATAMVVDPPSEVHRVVADACMTLFERHAYNPHYGRTLPRALAQLGLQDVATHAVSHQVQADSRHGVPQWELLVDQLAPALLALSLVTQQDLDAFHGLWHDDSTVCFAPLMVSTWGRRP